MHLTDHETGKKIKAIRTAKHLSAHDLTNEYLSVERIADIEAGSRASIRELMEIGDVLGKHPADLLRDETGEEFVPKDETEAAVWEVFDDLISDYFGLMALAR